MAEEKYQVIHVPNTLRAKVGSGSAIDPALIEQAEAAVQNMSGNFREWAKEDLEKLQVLVDDTKNQTHRLAEHYEDIFDIVHDLKGQGGTFGYTLITLVGDSLNKFLEGRTETTLDQLKIIIAHVEALKAIMAHDVKGSDNPIGQQIVNGLHQLVKKLGGVMKPIP